MQGHDLTPDRPVGPLRWASTCTTARNWGSLVAPMADQKPACRSGLAPSSASCFNRRCCPGEQGVAKERGMSSKDGVDERTPQRDQGTAVDKEHQDSREPGIAPGKRTRTSRIPRTPPPAPVQRKPVPSADSASGRASAERAELTERWTDTALRPDLFPPPVQRARSGAEEPPDHSQPAQPPRPLQPSQPSGRGIQALPADGEPLWANADRDAAALLAAFQGLGTTEQVVYRSGAQSAARGGQGHRGRLQRAPQQT